MEEHEAHFADLLAEAHEHINHLIKESYVAPKNAMEHWAGSSHFVRSSRLTFSVAFSSAVDWSERWIQCLLGFHFILFLAVIISRKNADLQTFLFLFIAVLVFLSETINSYCAIHWKEFSKQNYFDNQGVFIGILFAAPLLSICLFQLVSLPPLLLFLRHLLLVPFHVFFLLLIRGLTCTILILRSISFLWPLQL
jgi:hypothetical protein